MTDREGSTSHGRRSAPDRSRERESNPDRFQGSASPTSSDPKAITAEGSSTAQVFEATSDTETAGGAKTAEGSKTAEGNLADDNQPQFQSGTESNISIMQDASVQTISGVSIIDSLVRAGSRYKSMDEEKRSGYRDNLRRQIRRLTERLNETAAIDAGHRSPETAIDAPYFLHTSDRLPEGVEEAYRIVRVIWSDESSELPIYTTVADPIMGGSYDERFRFVVDLARKASFEQDTPSSDAEPKTVNDDGSTNVPPPPADEPEVMDLTGDNKVPEGVKEEDSPKQSPQVVNPAYVPTHSTKAAPRTDKNYETPHASSADQQEAASRSGSQPSPQAQAKSPLRLTESEEKEWEMKPLMEQGRTSNKSKKYGKAPSYSAATDKATGYLATKNSSRFNPKRFEAYVKKCREREEQAKRERWIIESMAAECDLAIETALVKSRLSQFKLTDMMPDWVAHAKPTCWLEMCGNIPKKPDSKVVNAIVEAGTDLVCPPNLYHKKSKRFLPYVREAHNFFMPPRSAAPHESHGDEFLTWVNRFVHGVTGPLPPTMATPVMTLRAFSVFTHSSRAKEDSIDRLGSRIAAQVYSASSRRMFPPDDGVWPDNIRPRTDKVKWMGEDWDVIKGFLQRIHPVAANYFILTSCLARNDGDWLKRVTDDFPQDGWTIAQSRRVLEGMPQGLIIGGNLLLQRDNSWFTKIIFTSWYYYCMARVLLRDMEMDGNAITVVNERVTSEFRQITLDPVSLENCLKMSYSGKVPKETASSKSDNQRLHKHAQGIVSRVVLNLATVSRAIRRYCCGVGLVDTIGCTNTAINMMALGHYFACRHVAKALDRDDVTDETHNGLVHFKGVARMEVFGWLYNRFTSARISPS